MPWGFVKSAVSAVSSFAGNAIASYVPKITSIVTPTISGLNMGQLGSNLMNKATGMAVGYATNLVGGAIDGAISSVTGKVDSLIRQGVQSVVGRIPSGFTRAITTLNILQEGSAKNFSGIMGGNYSAQANDHYSKQIKALLKTNKSPYNFDALNEKAHMQKDNNKFGYSHLHYPQEVSNLGDGHYIIFDILHPDDVGYQGTPLKQVSATNFKSGTSSYLGLVGEGKRQSKVTEGIVNSNYAIGGNTYQSYNVIPSDKILSDRTVIDMTSGRRYNKQRPMTIKTTIVLGMPNQSHSFDYKVENNSGVDTGFTQAIINFIEGAFGGEGIVDNLKDLGGEGLGRAIRGLIGSISPGAETLETISTGFVYNPRTEMAFKSVGFRDFSFTFDLIAKNEFEKDQIHNIVKAFKFYMSPEARGGEDGSGQLMSPSEFQITYAYRENKNNYIPSISRCMLTNAKFDYSPDNKFHTFYPDSEGAPPIHVKMELSFTEMEIMTKETIARGY